MTKISHDEYEKGGEDCPWHERKGEREDKLVTSHPPAGGEIDTN